MEHFNKYVEGTCHEMCPIEEVNMRERGKLLHVLEIVPGTQKDKIPKADRKRMVKSFCRSAAGKSMLDPKNLRPPNILLKTINYLLEDVISREDVPWRIIYDFTMDRLRSVRQDLIIQNASHAYCISIFQPIVRFHAYAAYRLCEENINHFDPVINNTHLQECLKRLLCMYDYCEELEKRDNLPHNPFLIKNRPQFEGIYLLFNLGCSEAITRALNLSKMWRTDMVEMALELSLCYMNKNFIRTCRIMKELPILHLAVAALHLPMIRRDALKVMSVAYNSKNLTFPTQTLKDLLLYDSEQHVMRDCKYYGFEVSHDGIYFVKNAFNENKKLVPPSHQSFIDQRLSNNDLSSLILFGE